MNFWVSNERKTLEEVTVTPEIARKMLIGNTVNRNKKNLRIEMYAQDMADGRWRLTGDTIRFAKDGRLLDGQNRLMACIKANVPFVTDVKVGLDDVVMRNVDRGAARSFADQLKIEGYKNCANIASITGGVYRYYAGGSARYINSKMSAKYPMSIDMGFETLEKHPLIVDAASYYSASTRARLAPVSLIGACKVICQEISIEDANDFYGKFADGISDSYDSPVAALTRALESINAKADALGRRDVTYKLPLIVKAWNAYIMGEPMTRIIFRRGGLRAEKFPEFMIPDNTLL